MAAERHTGLIQARCQPGFAALVERAATARGMSPSEWVRQASRTALQLEGFDPAAIRQSEHALVSGARVLTVWQGEPPEPMADHFPAGHVAAGDEHWLPIEDEAPGYDPQQHWKKVPPSLRIESARVVRVFEIIPKSLEAF